MLHPARLRVNLFVLLLRGAGDDALPVENKKACGARSLIDRTNVTAHVILRKTKATRFRRPLSSPKRRSENQRDPYPIPDTACALFRDDEK